MGEPPDRDEDEAGLEGRLRPYFGGPKEGLTITMPFRGGAGVAVCVARMLRESARVRTLRLHTGVGETEAGLLAEAMRGNGSLTSLALLHNTMGVAGAAHIARALEGNAARSLTALEIGYNMIGPPGADALVAALETNATLTALRLPYNMIGPRGARALAGLLAGGRCALVELDLFQNMIGDEGAAALAGALASNRTLTHLRAELNGIGPDGTAAIAAALREPGAVLAELHLGANNLDPDSAAALVRCPSLRTLGVRGATVWRQSAAALGSLCASVAQSRTLRVLELGHAHPFEDGPARAVEAALRLGGTVVGLRSLTRKSFRGHVQPGSGPTAGMREAVSENLRAREHNLAVRHTVAGPDGAAARLLPADLVRIVCEYVEGIA